MPMAVVRVAAAVLILHGLVHLMGTAVYMKIGKVEGLPYKTTLLSGRWDLGESGIRVFGALWVVPALGFMLCGLGLLAGWPWAQPMAVGLALLSLLLTLLDWNTAYAGAIVDTAILCVIWLAPAVLAR